MTVLTSRERVKLALAHRDTDRTPVSMICSGINSPAREEFARYVEDKFHTPLANYLHGILDVESVGVGCKQMFDPGFDLWGVHRSTVQNPNGGSYDEIDFAPLAACETAGDLAKHRWPQPEWFDFAALPAIVKKSRQRKDNALFLANGNIFETAWFMRGFEQIFMDFILNPEFAHALLNRVTDFYIDYFSRQLEQVPGKIDLVFTADDIAGQNGLLMSLEMWEEFVKPCHTRLNAKLHEYGVKVIYHSDGAVTEAVPGLIDMGIDILQALQFDAANMDPKFLKQTYGDRLCFEGGVSVQKTLPFGTPDDVRREVANLRRILGRQGGYIIGPSHVIQEGTPVANIAAFFESVQA